MSRQLADLLLKDKLINQSQFEEADENSKKLGSSYVNFLIQKNYVSETKLLYYLAKKYGLPSINLSKFEIKKEIIELIDYELARRYGVVPIQSQKNVLVVAIYDPTRLSDLENLKFRTKMNIEAVLTTYSAYKEAMTKYYGGSAFVGAAIENYQQAKRTEAKDSTEDDAIEVELMKVHDIDEGGSGAEDAPVVSLVNGILGEAISRQASDIHIEPYEKRFRVRMRMDGVLQEVSEIPLEMRRAVTARLKIMSRMDISESRIPQDGRMNLRVSGRDVDMRVNAIPCLHGEKVVMRVLNKTNMKFELAKLGFDKQQEDLFRKGIASENGMVLVTGPTGSGKTTTLYSALLELNQVTDNISTAEDPVEYNFDGINQVEVRKEIGLNFASVLRAFLRQDPDIILVGEIRDYETAEVAVQAALTGHLVLSTLHTNDAASAITRLINMGIEPFLITSALNTVVAQRLVRKICTKCKIEDNSIPAIKLMELGLPEGTKIYKGKGCSHCNKTGYRGRAAVHEVFAFTTQMKNLVLDGVPASHIKEEAIKNGMKTLRMSALRKVAEGLTSIEEALANTMES